MLITLFNWLIGDDDANREREEMLRQDAAELRDQRMVKIREQAAIGAQEARDWHAREVAKVHAQIQACPKCHGSIPGGGFWCCRPLYGDLEYLDARLAAMFAPM